MTLQNFKKDFKSWDTDAAFFSEVKSRRIESEWNRRDVLAQEANCLLWNIKRYPEPEEILNQLCIDTIDPIVKDYIERGLPVTPQFTLEYVTKLHELQACDQQQNTEAAVSVREKI